MNKLEKINLIKIDTECYEPYVLKGYHKYLNFHKPIIFIEILYDQIGQYVQEIVEKLTNNAYIYFFIDENQGLIQSNQIVRKSDKYFNYLLIPINKIDYIH